VSGATKGLAVGVDGLREYSVLHDGGTVAVTLLRAVGFLSRGDLPERRGHAGPELETPSAQCLGTRDYRYAIVPLDEQHDLKHAARSIREWLSPPIVTRGDGRPRRFVSFADADPSLVMTSVRAARDGSLVIRLANPSAEAATAALRFWRPIRGSRPVDLRDGETDLGHNGLDVLRTAAPLEVVGELARVHLEPYEIGTWTVTIA
jgi:alpha-mannosidase